MASVFLNAQLLEEVTKVKSFSVEGDTVAQVLDNIEKKFPGFKSKLLTNEKTFKNYLLVAGTYKEGEENKVIERVDDNKENLVELKIITIPCGG